METRTYVLTLTGAAQQLSDVLPDSLVNISTPGVPASGLDTPSKKFNSWAMISLQGGAANAGAVFVGSDNTVNSTAYGIRIPAAVAGLPGPPLFFGPFNRAMKFEGIWVFGSVNEKLQILAIEW